MTMERFKAYKLTETPDRKIRAEFVAMMRALDIKAPTFVNDTIHVECEVTEVRPTSKDPSRGLVRTMNLVKNQKGETVLTYDPLRMMRGRA